MAQDIIFNNNSKSKDLILEHWWVDEGEVIHHDQQIASVRDGERVYLVRAPLEGILYKKYKQNNESFNKLEPLGKIISKEEAGNIKISGKLSETERKIIDSIHQENRGSTKKRIYIKASPSARRKAQQNNINLELITGTGPNGRIQLRDVNEYINKNQPKPQIKTYKNKTIRYNIPLTGLARRLAQRNNLDISKIPAPPGAHRIKRKDVERYLRNPQGAVEEIEREYDIREISQLDNPIILQDNLLPVNTEVKQEPEQEEAKVIRLTTEEPNVIPTSDEVINLDTVVILALDSSLSNLLLNEPSESSKTVIRLSSEEGNFIPSQKVIKLEGEEPEKPLYLKATTINLLNEPDENSAEENKTVIRLSTSEDSEIPSEKVVILSGEQAKAFPTEKSNHTQTKETDEETLALLDKISDLVKKIEELKDKENPHIVQLSTLVNLNLIDLVKKYNPPTNEIGQFLKNYLLSVIYSVFDDYRKNTDNVYYIADINSDVISSYNSDKISKIKESITQNRKQRDKVKIQSDDLIVVELLGYNLDDVSGLINPENRIVLYLSYIKNFDKFFYEPTNIRSILKLSLEFDAKCLKPEEGIEFIEELRNSLEELEVEI